MSATTGIVAPGRARRTTTGPVLGMILFVASEAMFFAAFFGAYFALRAAAPEWPPAGTPPLEIGVATLLTIVLVTSSVVLQAAVHVLRSGDLRRASVLILVTVLLGVTFLALQAYDYSTLALSIKQNVFGTLFYVMTGLHMAHVFGGVVFLGLVFVQSRTGDLTPSRFDSLEAGSIYWHFVDVVWLCLFTSFYLLTRGAA